MRPGGSISWAGKQAVENCSQRLDTGPATRGAPPRRRVLSSSTARGFPPPPRAGDTQCLFIWPNLTPHENTRSD